jgi:RNA polymerase sigma-70 factor (ECF subfamily)
MTEMQDASVAADPTTSVEDVFREHGARLCRSLMMYTGDAEVAGDAVAEAFAQAIRRGDQLRSPRAWITTTAYRIAAAEMGNRRRTAYAQIEVAHEMPEPAFDLIAALARLSPKQRAAAILHFYEGYTKAETAEIIGSTASAVGVHLNRARRRLRDLLGDDDG